jgi:hypothetical protein
MNHSVRIMEVLQLLLVLCSFLIDLKFPVYLVSSICFSSGIPSRHILRTSPDVRYLHKRDHQAAKDRQSRAALRRALTSTKGSNGAESQVSSCISQVTERKFPGLNLVTVFLKMIPSYLAYNIALGTHVTITLQRILE